MAASLPASVCVIIVIYQVSNQIVVATCPLLLWWRMDSLNLMPSNQQYLIGTYIYIYIRFFFACLFVCYVMITPNKGNQFEQEKSGK